METRSNFGSQKFGTTKIRNDSEDSYASIKVASERLGHSTSVLTLDTYSHVPPHMQEEAAKRIENVLFRAAGTHYRHTKQSNGQFAEDRGLPV